MNESKYMSDEPPFF